MNFHTSNRKRRHENAFSYNNGTLNNIENVNNIITVTSDTIASEKNNSKILGISNSTLGNPFGNTNNSTNQINNNHTSGIERRIFKFNNKIYPFNSSNVNLSNFAASFINNESSSNTTNNNINSKHSLNVNSSFKNSGPTQLLSNFNINNKLGINSNFFNDNISTTKLNENQDLVNDQLIENMLSEVSQISTKEDIKSYLKHKLTTIISKKIFFFILIFILKKYINYQITY